MPTCPPQSTIGQTITRFVGDMRALEGWAVSDDAEQVLNTIDQWAISDTLKTSLKNEWAFIQRNWNACLTAPERTKVNRAIQHFNEHAGDIPIVSDVVGAVGGVGDVLQWPLGRSAYGIPNMVRVLLVIGGAVLVLYGLQMLSKELDVALPGVPFVGK